MCDMRTYLLGLVLILFDISVASEKPNIIYILSDDVGWNDVSFHGSNQIPTPNIDALAYSGLILHKHYVESVCTPSRAALLTGRYPSNIGMQSIPLGGAEPRALPPGKILPEYLKDLGYKTSLVGKWHLGFYEEKFTPLHRGFDSFFGYYNGLIGYYDHIYDDPLPRRKEICKEGKTGFTLEFGETHLYGLDFHRNKTPAWDLSGQYATDLFTEEAVKQIENHDTSSPLFLYLAHLACHAGNWGQNLEAPLEMIQKFNYIIDPNRRTYAAMMWKLDESVGKIVAALKNKGMLENSIIVFTSDNGAPTLLRSSWQTPGSNYPLRGMKVTQWEGGVRTPALMWSPLLKHNAHVSHHLMHITDWLPTLITAAGGDLTKLKNSSLDGVDQWDALVHNTPSARDEMLQMFDDWRNVIAVRKGDWKLVEGTNLQGAYDGYSGDSGSSSSSPAYDLNKIYNSEAGKAIAAVKSFPDQSAVLELRKEVSLKCPLQENSTFCDTFRNQRPCLFNVVEDPCEMNDVSQLFPDMRDLLLSIRDKYRVRLVQSGSKPYDLVNANPAKFNNSWEPWVAEGQEGMAQQQKSASSQQNLLVPFLFVISILIIWH